MQGRRFTQASVALALVGCAVALVGALAFLAPSTTQASLAFAALLGTAFAAKNAHTVARRGYPRFAAATVAAMVGAWLVVAPLRYTGVSDAMTGTVQAGGGLLAAFSGYTALLAIEGIWRPENESRQSDDGQS